MVSQITRGATLVRRRRDASLIEAGYRPADVRVYCPALAGVRSETSGCPSPNRNGEALAAEDASSLTAR
ncbi:hypothetical protein [Paludifilum halophilum]|uniref:Uncharacterized protein n=1 Tax=Paludifilum halophilum TaxID=1642702 RepID=A0A235B9C3_9BACL|nr:hypothetical protein [Paludifilum halophilum]OYD08861.1 hypothetical protein CHM34_03490 [Paludifilum halophilum]